MTTFMWNTVNIEITFVKKWSSNTEKDNIFTTHPYIDVAFAELKSCFSQENRANFELLAIFKRRQKSSSYI